MITEIIEDDSMFYGPICTRNTSCNVTKHSNIKITALRQKVRPEKNASMAQEYINKLQERIKEFIS